LPETVSVIVPIYNGENFLAAALESALAQTHAPHEVIAVDDGSSDASAAVAARLEGVRVLRKENGGVATARNAGVAASSGNFLAFLDHDDLWAPRKLELQLQALQSGSTGFATCHLRYFFMGDIPRWFRGPTDGTAVAGFVPSTWLVRRDAFERVGPFDPSYVNGNDTDWLARAGELGIRPLVVPECLVDYRVHASNASADGRRFSHEITSVLRARVHRQRTAGQ
jgi:glycosyltransferase involved in cell wall biosynthesis